MPRKNLRSFECLHCGRVWTPRNPDNPKLKCPTCGKYLTKEVEKDDSNGDGSSIGGDSGVFVPPTDGGDLPDPCPGEAGEADLLLAGEKDQSPEVSEGPASCGSPELEEPITDPDPDEEPGAALPSSGLGGGMWAGLGVLIMGVIAALWYLYRKRSLADDLDTAIPDHDGSIPDPGLSSDELYGRGRGAYRGRI